ncbi:MAG: DUF4340 domain-containing protein [Planctomycetota bacterium]
MKFKTTLILLIVAAIGIGYVFLYERKQLPQEEWERLQKKVIPDFKSSLVKKIELKNESGTVVLEKRADSYWYIIDPQKIRADNSEIKSILSEFEFMTKIGSFKQESGKTYDLKDYGLDVIKTSITMYTDVHAQPDTIQVSGPKSKYTVFVGQKLAAGDNVYMKLDANEEVFVVPGSLYEKAHKTILDLRSKWVFSFDKEAVSRLQIKTGAHDIVCGKKVSSWRLNEPIDDLADMERIKEILTKLKNLQIENTDFVSDDPSDLAKFGLDNPQLTVTITENDVAQTVHFGYTLDNKVYVKRTDEPTIFFLKDMIIADLNRKPNDLRDRRVVRFDTIGTYGLNKLEIKTATDSMVIEKALDLDWKITKPVNIYADQDTVKNFIEQIKTLEIEDFVSDKPADLAAYGLQDVTFEICVTKEDDKQLARFYVGNKQKDGTKCYVKRINEDPVYTVATAEFYDKLENAILAFRDRLVSEFDRELAKEIVIEKPDRTFICEKSSKKDSEGQDLWELSKPVQAVADTELINQIVWSMSFLKADYYVEKSPKNLKLYGLDEPGIKVSVTYEKVVEPVVEGQNKRKEEKQEATGKPAAPVQKTVETRTLLVGKTLEAGDKVDSYCMYSDSDFVFVLSWPKIKDFNAELVPAKVLHFEKMDVRKLSLGYGDTTIKMEKINNVWKMNRADQKDPLGGEVDYYIRNLYDLKGSYIEQYKATNLTQFALDTPQLVVTVGLESGDEVLYIGKKKDEKSYYVKNKDRDYIFVVDNESIAKLLKKEDDFMKVTDPLLLIPADAANAPMGKPPMGAGMPHGKMPGGSGHGGMH